MGTGQINMSATEGVDIKEPASVVCDNGNIETDKILVPNIESV